MGDTSDDARGEQLQQEQQSPQQQEEKSASAKPTLSAATVFVELIIRCDIRSSSDVTARNYSFFLSLTPPLVSNSIAAPMKLTDAKRNTRQLAARRTAA